MRVFYALTFSDDTKHRLSRYRDIISEKSSKGKFIDESNIHLTLEFIGEVTPDDLPLYENILSDLAFSEVTLTINSFGKFTKKNKDIIWLGIKPNNSLNDIVSKIDKELLNHNLIEQQLEFIPHITLGRGIVFDGELEDYAIKPFDVPVVSVALMVSKRVDDKLVYSPICELLL